MKYPIFINKKIISRFKRIRKYKISKVNFRSHYLLRCKIFVMYRTMQNNCMKFKSETSNKQSRTNNLILKTLKLYKGSRKIGLKIKYLTFKTKSNIFDKNTK